MGCSSECPGSHSSAGCMATSSCFAHIQCVHRSGFVQGWQLGAAGQIPAQEGLHHCSRARDNHPPLAVGLGSVPFSGEGQPSHGPTPLLSWQVIKNRFHRMFLPSNSLDTVSPTDLLLCFEVLSPELAKERVVELQVQQVRGILGSLEGTQGACRWG